MAFQTIGNFGGSAPQPAPSQASVPRPAVPQRDSVPADVQPKATTPPEQPSQEQVKRAVDALRESMKQSSSSNLQFSIDGDTGQTIVRVTDRQTGELIRQIPSEELLELAKSLDRMQGVLLRQQV